MSVQSSQEEEEEEKKICTLITHLSIRKGFFLFFFLSHEIFIYIILAMNKKRKFSQMFGVAKIQ
jgi:Ca2+/Na+ antiporter